MNRWAIGAALLLVSVTAHAGGLGVTVHGVKGRVSAKTPVNMQAKLRWNGPSDARITYAWTSISGPALPYDTERSEPTLTIAAGELSEGKRYEIELTVSAKYRDEDNDPPEQHAEAKTVIAFDVNAPPSGGDCKMDVAWRGPASASLTVSAPGWSDDDGRVQFRYWILRNGKAHLAKNWSHADKYLAQSLARPGDKLQTRCEVRDRMGDGAEALSDEVVRPAP